MVVEYQLTLYLCSQCARVHNTHQLCVAHEIRSHAELREDICDEMMVGESREMCTREHNARESNCGQEMETTVDADEDEIVPSPSSQVTKMHIENFEIVEKELADEQSQKLIEGRPNVASSTIYDQVDEPELLGDENNFVTADANEIDTSETKTTHMPIEPPHSSNQGHDWMQPHNCRYCQRRFSSKQTCLAHETVQHESTNSTKVACMFAGCHVTFATHGAMAKHRDAIHEKGDERKYGLSVVGDSSSGHVSKLAFADNKPSLFYCQFCNKAFNRQIGQLNHERSMHTMERPYECDKCEKRFASRSAMGTHRRLKH